MVSLVEASAASACPVASEQGWHGNDDHDRQKMVANGVAQPCEGDVIPKQKQLHPQVVESQQKKEQGEPALAML